MIKTEVTLKMDQVNEDERRDFGKRYFSRGGVKVALLKLLEQEPMHGYQMIKAIEEQSGGMYSPSAGSIYPTLQLLVERGFAAVKDEDGGKKVYMITEQGRSAIPLLPHSTKHDAANGRYSPNAEPFRNDKIRLKLGLSNESYHLLQLVKQAEQEASASMERKEKLQRLLSDQHQQLNAFLAAREQDSAAAAREAMLAKK
jgi:DNA-binding PadR family transcriptional regulator